MSDRETKAFDVDLATLAGAGRTRAAKRAASAGAEPSLVYAALQQYMAPRTAAESLQDIHRAAQAARELEQVVNEAAAVYRRKVLPIEEPEYEFFEADFDAEGYLTAPITDPYEFAAGAGVSVLVPGEDETAADPKLQKASGGSIGVPGVMLAAGIPAATAGSGAILTAFAFSGSQVLVNPYVALIVLLSGIVLGVTAILALRDYLKA